MSKQFNKLKDPKLGLHDKLPIGKYKNCRICDVLDDWEYLKWLHTNSLVMFQQPVLDKITAAWAAWSKDIYYTQEIAPYNSPTQWFSDMEDDVPY